MDRSDGPLAGALIAVPFRGTVVYSERPDTVLSPGDLQLLRERFSSQLEAVLPFVQEHHSHVFVPLSAPEEGYHASFSGRFDLPAVLPFFRHAPNALTVVDGRAWGYFRVRFLHVSPTLDYERIAEIEVHAAQTAGEVGFELFWGPPEREPTHIRLYDRASGEGSQTIANLMSEWRRRFGQWRTAEGQPVLV